MMHTLVFLAAVAAPAAANDDKPVTERELAAIQAALGKDGSGKLRSIVGPRVLESVRDGIRRSTPELLTELVEECSFVRADLIEERRVVFLDYRCPQRPRNAMPGIEAHEEPGYMIRLWRHPLGLTVQYAVANIPVRPRPTPVPPPMAPPLRPTVGSSLSQGEARLRLQNVDELLAVARTRDEVAFGKAVAPGAVIEIDTRVPKIQLSQGLSAANLNEWAGPCRRAGQASTSADQDAYDVKYPMVCPSGKLSGNVLATFTYSQGRLTRVLVQDIAFLPVPTLRASE